MSHLYMDGLTIAREGIRVYAQLRSIRASRVRGRAPIFVRFRSLKYPLMLRPGTDDVGAAVNNIVRREYGRFPPPVSPRVMVDAGAYIGDTSIYFLNQYPELKIYALEPNPESLDLAGQNLRPYGSRVILIPAALSKQDGLQVQISGKGTGANIQKEFGGEVESISMPSLLRKIPEGKIGILKLDIEGAEDEVLSGNISDWLSKVEMIIVETHGPEITQRVLSVLSKNGWRSEMYRNLYYCFPGNS